MEYNRRVVEAILSLSPGDTILIDPVKLNMPPCKSRSVLRRASQCVNTLSILLGITLKTHVDGDLMRVSRPVESGTLTII